MPTKLASKAHRNLSSLKKSSRVSLLSRGKVQRRYGGKAALATAKKALTLAKANAATIERKIYQKKAAVASHDFEASPNLNYNLTDLGIGTGEGQFSGNTMQMQSCRLRYQLQNVATAVAHQVRVLVVQFKSETTVGTTPTVPLDTGAAPPSIHGGAQFIMAPKLRFTDDPALSQTTLQYTILYDKTHKLGGVSTSTSAAIADVDMVLKFKGKSGFYRRDVGTTFSHEKGGIWLYFLGGDLTKGGATTRHIDVRYMTQLRFKDA